ncbi:MAG: 30S ribosomal protein S14 [Alphaproteobacteria bacterium]
MAKKGMVARDVKRAKLAKAQAAKRTALKKQMRANALGEELSIKEQLELARKLSELPRNGSKVRMRNRCRMTGRPRGYYRKFGISRVLLRELGSQGMIPGLVKSSW